jgi:hypothetical protein
VKTLVRTPTEIRSGSHPSGESPQNHHAPQDGNDTTSDLKARPLAEVARGMYKETGDDGRRKYTVAEITETFGVSRKTVYWHLEPSGGRRQPAKTTPLLRDARHEHLPPPVVNTASAALSRQPATGS